jgi:hypothetical protein
MKQHIKNFTTEFITKLTHDNINNNYITLRKPILITDTPESIGMVVNIGNDLYYTTPTIAIKTPTIPNQQQSTPDIVWQIYSIIGPTTIVQIINVSLQKQILGWTFEHLCEYFDNKQRLKNAPICLNNIDSLQEKLKHQRQYRHKNKKPTTKKKQIQREEETWK